MARTTYTTRRNQANGGTQFSVDPARAREFRKLCAGVEPVHPAWHHNGIVVVHAPPARIQRLRAYLALNGWTDSQEEARVMRELAGVNSETVPRVSASSFGMGVPGRLLGKGQ